MPDVLDWENLRVFAALRRHASFTAAARELGLDATTLSRRLTQLEEQLGAVLFQRTTLGLRATDAASAIAASVERIERQVELVRREAAGGEAEARGVVRLAVTAELADSFLLPRLAPLRARHPDLELQLVTGDRFVDLTRGEADLAIRFQIPGKGVPADARATIEVTARRLGTLDIGVFASTAYVARAGRPRDAHDVAGHDLVLTRAAATYLPGSPWFARVDGRGRAAVRVDDPGSMVAAIVAGLGLGAMAVVHAGGARRSGPHHTARDRGSKGDLAPRPGRPRPGGAGPRRLGLRRRAGGRARVRAAPKTPSEIEGAVQAGWPGGSCGGRMGRRVTGRACCC